jgi:beta-lactamase class A
MATKTLFLIIIIRLSLAIYLPAYDSALFISSCRITPSGLHHAGLPAIESFPAAEVNTWTARVMEEIRRINEGMDGSIGVYIKNLSDGHSVNHNAEDYWYLSSTIKIPLAIAVLQEIEEGKFSLDDELVLKESDFVDGAGDLLWQRPGNAYSIAELIDKMVRNSDSSATDMLIRLIGEEEFNSRIEQSMVREGFNRITTILQVRHDAFSELHENAKNLTNLDFIEANSIISRPERLNRLIEMMSIDETELKAQSIEEAFERYYERKLNSAKLVSMGILLERLYKGELLNEKHTRLLLEMMENITTGERRIKAGLPANFQFAQKTGTQIESACNVGIVYPENKENKSVIIAVCMVNYGEIGTAEKAFENIGRTISEIILSE